MGDVDANVDVKGELADDIEVEFVPDDGGEQNPEPTIDELKAKLDETVNALTKANQLNEELKGKVNNTDAIITGFEKAASKLTQQGGAEPVPQGEKETELDKEALKEAFYDDPVKASEQLMQSLYEQKANRLQADIVRVHLSNSKARVPDDLKNLAKGYEDEVEQVIKATPPELLIQYPEPYTEAYKRVIANHLTDVVKNVKDAGTGADGNVNGKKEKPFTETSSVAPPQAKKKRVIKMTDEMKKYAEQMQKRGVDPNEALRRKYGYER